MLNHFHSTAKKTVKGRDKKCRPFRPKQWTANWFHIFPVLRQNDTMIFFKFLRLTAVELLSWREVNRCMLTSIGVHSKMTCFSKILQIHQQVL